MSLGCRFVIFAGLAAAAAAAPLRICADPDNLPYSNRQQQGLENRLADFVGAQLHRPVRYVWISQRGKYFQALQANQCDAVMEAPANFAGARTTRPYYRSSYVFLTRADRGLDIRSFDDPRLRTLKIGLQIMGADDAAAPPARALATRGILQNVTWYRAYQTYITANRPQELVEAVARGDVDVAIAWGPLAGYFAKTCGVPLAIHAVSPQSEHSVPFAFDISMAVASGNTQLAGELDNLLRAHAGEVRRIVAQYGIPTVSASHR
jgi:mxaJ protein